VATVCLQWLLNIFVFYYEVSFINQLTFVANQGKNDELARSIEAFATEIEDTSISYWVVDAPAFFRNPREKIRWCHAIWSGVSTIGFVFQIIGSVYMYLQ
jgi:hypothetical protein